MLKLKPKDVQEMKRIVARPSSPAGLVRRVRVVLWTAEGLSGREIAERLELSPEAVSRIRARFVAGGVQGLFDVPKAGRKDHAVSPQVVAQIAERAMSPPPAGRSRWTTRLLAREFGLTSGCISDVLRRCELKPHLVRTYKVSRDPKFAAKVNVAVLRLGALALFLNAEPFLRALLYRLRIHVESPPWSSCCIVRK